MRIAAGVDSAASTTMPRPIITSMQPIAATKPIRHSFADFIAFSISKRTLDFADRCAPGSHLALSDLRQPKKSQRQDGQNKQNHQSKRGIQTIIGLHDQVA